MKYRLSHLLEYGALRGISGLIAILPYRAALVLGWLIARLTFLALHVRMDRFRQRVRQVMGAAKSEAEVRAILWIAWRNFVFNIVESMRTPKINLQWINAHIDHSEARLLMDELQAGRGVVLAVPHMGNWDLAGVGCALLGIPLVVIGRRQKNPLVDAWLNQMREYTGVVALHKESNALAGIVRRLKQGQVLAILPDVRAKTGKMQTRFLGVDTEIPAGMALFAREANVIIQPAVVMRIGWTHHRWHGFPPIHPNPALDRETDMKRMTQMVMDHFGEAIREHPEQYFWFNNRWVLSEDRAHTEGRRAAGEQTQGVR